jgi:biopolymer transport protein ExbB
MMTHGSNKRLIVTMMAVLVCLWSVAALVAQAEPPAKAGHDAGVAQQVSVKELLDKGGVLMYPLGLMSVVGVAFVIYFFVILRRRQIVPDLLRDDVLDKIETGQFNDARTACGYKPCAFSEVAVAALDYANSVEKPDPTLLKEVIEGEGARQAVALQSQIQYLLDVAVIAPMMGLLGTVFGMMRAFNVVAFDLAKAKPMLLAAGVAEALITTAAGLLIGIPCMMFYAYFRGQTSKLVSDLEVASGQVMTAMLKKRA